MYAQIGDYRIGDIVEFGYHGTPRLVKIALIFPDAFLGLTMAGDFTTTTGKARFKFEKLECPKIRVQA